MVAAVASGAVAASGLSHPAVAALLGLGAAAVAGGVVAMTWSVHVRQIRLAELLARRQLVVTAGPGAGGPGADIDTGEEGGDEPAGRGGASPPVVIDGPDTVVAGEQARYRVRPSPGRTVMTWAVGGGSVSQAPDPSHPEELLLIAGQPGDLTVTVRVREGIMERRGIKSVTALPDVTPAPPFTLRLFLHGWGLVVVAVLVAGFAGALTALGTLTPADFIALAAPLAALIAVVAVVRGAADAGGDGGRPGPPGR